VKAKIKELLRYHPLPETERVRQAIQANNVKVLPFTTPWQGDFLYKAIKKINGRSALEVGFASGSTAAYMLAGMEQTNGTVISIDPKPEDYLNIGAKLLNDLGFSDRHTLVKRDSALALPDLLSEGEEFDLAYLDGWKTFDHLATDIYYITRLLNVGGMMVFDDTQLPSVQKVASLLLRHYLFEEVKYEQFENTFRLWLWRVATYRYSYRSYRAFRKVTPIGELSLSKDWTFYRPF
jgi:predicted O-methyltransferase YrrM